MKKPGDEIREIWEQVHGRPWGAADARRARALGKQLTKKPKTRHRFVPVVTAGPIRGPVVEMFLDDARSADDHELEAHEREHWASDAGILWSMVLTLPEKRRAVVLMHKEGYSKGSIRMWEELLPS